jgi:hypothetical protein
MTPVNFTQFLPLVVDALQRLIPIIGEIKGKKDQEELFLSLSQLQTGTTVLQHWLEQRERRFSILMVLVVILTLISTANLILLIYLITR